MTAARRLRPRVSVNFAITWDGRISTRNRTPSDFSSKADKRRLLEIRSQSDAVLAGAATIAADRMTMGLPVEALRAARTTRGQAAYPLRVLLSNSGRIDPALRIFETDISPVLIFSTQRMPRRTRLALQSKAELRLADDDTVDLPGMMRTLRREFDVRSVDCEGGGSVFRSLLAQDLVDEIHLTLCPRIFGGAKAPSLTGAAGSFLPHGVPCALKEMTVSEGECFLRYQVKR